MNRILRIIITALLMVVAVSVSAQSTGDRLFNEGLKLQQQGSSVSLKEAVKKFTAAKAVYTIAEKKKKCDNQISKCRRMLKAITESPIPQKEEEIVTVQQPEQPFITLGTDMVHFGSESDFRTVSVKSNRTKLHVIKNFEKYDTEDFVKMSQTKDEEGLLLEVGENPKTTMRQQLFYVYVDSKGDIGKMLGVFQKGKPVIMGCSKGTLGYKLKGGKETIKLFCNSDTIYNTGNNWRLAYYPDWIEVEQINQKQSQKKNASVPPGQVKEFSLRITAKPLKKNDPEYSTGRMGEVIIQSQNMEYNVIVIQKI